jgi:hypothetical protein
MAKNKPYWDNSRKWAIKCRSQFLHPNWHYYKRDSETGQIIDCKSDDEKFKSVRLEKNDN